MPIFMDRHDVSESVTAEIVAELHQKDLKIQHQFGCRGLTYWFDDVRKTAFCLIEAPSAEKLKEMHDFAHGVVPHRIIEVEPSIVESFLGRIEDPVTAKETRLNIINEPAFRIIMAVEPEIYSLRDYEGHSFRSLIDHCRARVNEMVREFEGRLAGYKGNRVLASFTSVSKAVKCALSIQSDIGINSRLNASEPVGVKIGLGAGVPVTEKDMLFEETVKLAENMCHVSAGITMTEEVKDLYRSENIDHVDFNSEVFILSEPDQKFLVRLMDFTGKEWGNTDLTVERFQRHLGLSKTQLYRKMTALTGNSPNNFLLLYRLKRILHMLRKEDNSIAEVAFSAGFSSPSYFAKCFRKVYGLSPTVYKSLI